MPTWHPTANILFSRRTRKSSGCHQRVLVVLRSLVTWLFLANGTMWDVCFCRSEHVMEKLPNMETCVTCTCRMTITPSEVHLMVVHAQALALYY